MSHVIMNKNIIFYFFMKKPTPFWLFVLVFSFNLLFWNGGYVHTSNVHLLLTKSIAEDKDLNIINNCDSNLQIYQSDVIIQNGKVYSKYPIGRSILSLPFYSVIYQGAKLLPFKYTRSFINNSATRD